MDLDNPAYTALLELARRGTVVFKWDPTRHPRDLNGRWKDVPDFDDGKLGSVLDRKQSNLPDNTQDLHTIRGHKGGWSYSPERSKLHEAIIEAYLAGHKPRKPKTMLFTAGGAGSGKTTALDQLPDVEPEDAVLIDPDDIKVLIPEYAKLHEEGDPRAVTLVHDESIDIATMLLRRVTEDGYNGTMDGTGASPMFISRINAALNKGYEVKVAYFNTDVATAMNRIEERKKKTKRAVNAAVAWNMHRNASRIFHEVYELGVEIDMYDTTGVTPIRFMRAEAGSDSEVLDQDLFDAFLAKGDVRSYEEIEATKRRRADRQSRLPKGTNDGWSLKPEARVIRAKHGITKGEIKGLWNTPEIYVATEELAADYGDGVTIDVEYDAKKILSLTTGAQMRDFWTRTGIEAATEGMGFHPDTTHLAADWARTMGYDAIEITAAAVGTEDDQDEDDAELGYEYGGGTYGEPQIVLLYPEHAKLNGKRQVDPKKPTSYKSPWPTKQTAAQKVSQMTMFGAKK